MTDADNHAGQMRDSQAEEMAKRLESARRWLPCSPDCGGPVSPIDGPQYGCTCGRAASLIRSQAERIRVLEASVPAIRAAALEEAVGECNRFRDAHIAGADKLPLAERAIPISMAEGARSCATAIRALKEAP